MAIYKRGKTWWTDFSVNGQRYRQSLDTTDWREAQAREKELITQTSEGKLVPSSQQFGRLAFSEAPDRYLESRTLDLAARSLDKERELLSNPKHYFGSLPVSKLNPEMLREYLANRKAAGLSNATLNMVAGAIRRALKMGKRWHLFEEEIKRLPEETHLGRALTTEEQFRLLEIAASNPEWQVLRCAIVLSLNTTMRSAELKHLCWRDVDFFERMITVHRSKTDAGRRTIPLNGDALTALLELRRRARELGADGNDHFIFPGCENGEIDPTKPQKTWRTAWRHLTRVSGLCGLRFHDLRHTAITVLAESQASEQTVMAIAGHVSRRMLEHYSHIRIEAKRSAVAALVLPKKMPSIVRDAPDKKAGYVTTHDTKALPSEGVRLEVIENVGGPGLTRTTDLTLIRGAL